MTDSQGISTAKHPVLSDGQGMCTGKQQIPSGSSEAGPGVLWVCPLGWFWGRGCCRSPAELWLVQRLSPPCSLSRAGAPGMALVNTVLAVVINFPRVPVCRALPNASLSLTEGQRGLANGISARHQQPVLCQVCRGLLPHVTPGMK